MTYVFRQGAEGGTHIEIRLAKPKPKDAEFLAKAGSAFRERIAREVEVLRQILAAHERETSSTEEPELPQSAERFLHQPVRGQ
jgi:hypothetical protein